MKKMDVPVGTVVAIKWVDSHTDQGWNRSTLVEKWELQRINTIGYVISSNRDGLKVTTSISNKGFTMDDLSIPWGCIETLKLMPKIGAFARR